MRLIGWIMVGLLGVGMLMPAQAAKGNPTKPRKTVVTGRVLVGERQKPLPHGSVFLAPEGKAGVRVSTDGKGNFKVSLSPGKYAAQTIVGGRRYLIGGIRIHGKRQRITLRFKNWREADPPRARSSREERGPQVSLLLFTRWLFNVKV